MPHPDIDAWLVHLDMSPRDENRWGGGDEMSYASREERVKENQGTWHYTLTPSTPKLQETGVFFVQVQS